MKNQVVCNNCQTLNPFHQLTCINCKAFLRDRVSNLDFWKTLEMLIESPKQAFTKIIYSEQKNFILVVLLLVALKFFINTIFIFLLNPAHILVSVNLARNYLLLMAVSILIVLFFASLIKMTNKIWLNITRFKDIYSILIYSFLPHIFALIILFPLELIFFGGYLFSNNPSPFIISETPAYIFLTLELLVVLWALYLSIIALITITKSKLYSITIGMLFYFTLFGSKWLLSFFIFK